jgi:Raf kinase inhibitor-like YbhB/YbcL family protein
VPAGGVPAGAKQANNDAGTAGWTGPCPPEGDPPHHYVFSVRALDTPIDAADGADAGVVRDQIEAATIAKGELTGLYGR